MKESLKRLGIVGPRHYQHLTEQLRKAQARATKLAQALDAARSEARHSRTKVDELTRTLRKHQADAANHQRRAEKLTAEIGHIKKESKQRVEQHQRQIQQAEQQRSAAFEDLQKRLAAAEHDLTMAREVLMAVDVKLDILEGAANVLDLRTRHVITSRDAATESAV